MNLVNSELVGVAATGPDDAWAIGTGGNGTGLGTVIEHWNGRTWRLVSSPNVDPRDNELRDVAALSPDDAWAVGRYWTRSLILHWDGKRWSYVPSPNRRATSLRAVVPVAPDDVWAFGTTYSDIGGIGPRYGIAMHWNGRDWRVVSLPELHAEFGLLAAAVAGPHDVWTVWDTGQGVPNAVVLRWDGSGWRRGPVPDFGPQGGLIALSALPTGQLWATGTDSFSDGHPVILRSCSS